MLCQMSNFKSSCRLHIERISSATILWVSVFFTTFFTPFHNDLLINVVFAFPMFMFWFDKEVINRVLITGYKSKSKHKLKLKPLIIWVKNFSMKVQPLMFFAIIKGIVHLIRTQKFPKN